MHALFLCLFNLPISYRIRVWLYNRINKKINSCRIRRGFFIDHPKRLSIGEDSFINYHCHIYCGDLGNVVIGKRVFIGPDVKICNVTHLLGNQNQRAGEGKWEDIKICDGVWIGIGSTILPGVCIGEGSVVAAGSVVVNDVEPNTLVGGVPAKAIKHFD